MTTSDEVARLTLYCDHRTGTGGGRRVIEVQTKTDLDTIAKTLRAAAGWEGDPDQYRFETNGKLFGNPRGRSQPQVVRGKTTPLERMLQHETEFTFRSNLQSSVEHRVAVEARHSRIWQASDYPLLIDLDGEIERHSQPKDWELELGWVNTPENAAWLATGKTTRKSHLAILNLDGSRERARTTKRTDPEPRTGEPGEGGGMKSRTRRQQKCRSRTSRNGAWRTTPS